MIINNIPNKESSNNRVNTNLLTNWYFANPVNRRGGFCFVLKGVPCHTDTALTSTGTWTDAIYPVEVINETYSRFISNGGNTYYVSTADVKHGYYKAGDTIDGWRIINPPLTVKFDKKLTLDNSVGTSATYYGQNFEIDLTGRSVTLSVLTSEGLYSGTGVINNNASWEIRFSVGEDVEMYYQKGTSGFGVFFVLSAGAILDIIAVKLELGDIQTLAYQDDSGNWQLYEIPNYEEEYAKCVAMEPKVFNDNLLINWYFKNPVNRNNGYYVPIGIPAWKDTAMSDSSGNTLSAYPVTIVNSTYASFTGAGGSTLYVSTDDCKKGYVTSGFTFDEWYNRTSNMGVSLVDDGLKFEVLTTATSTQYRFLNQRIRNYKNLLGKEVTLSLLVRDFYSTAGGTFGSGVRSSTSVKLNTTSLGSVETGNVAGFYTATFILPDAINSSHSGLNIHLEWNNNANKGNAGDYIVIEAIKLELGNTQTLAYQDENGEWVLNEIPDYQDQLDKCLSTIASEDTDYDIYRVRNIAAGTAAMTAGSSTLASGAIYFQYE